MSEINIENANCTQLSLMSPVLLKKDKEEKEITQFSIEAYTGKPVDRWWGKLAINVKGIKAKKNIPVLLNHSSDKIVGYSTKTYKNDSFFVEGKFSSATESAKEVKNLAAEGFPWQASIGVRPLKILSIEEKAKHTVNGIELNGPAEVWLESEVFETSFVPLGADDDTNIAAFSKIVEKKQEQQTKNEVEMEITIEKLEKDFPELLQSIREDAVKGTSEELEKASNAETERVFAIAGEFFGREKTEKFKKIIETGVTVEQLKAISELSAKEEVQPEKKDDVKKEILKNLEVDGTENLGSETKESKPTNFMGAWQKIQKEEQCSSGDAMKKAVRLYPELYTKHAQGGKQ